MGLNIINNLPGWETSGPRPYGDGTAGDRTITKPDSASGHLVWTCFAFPLSRLPSPPSFSPSPRKVPGSWIPAHGTGQVCPSQFLFLWSRMHVLIEQGYIQAVVCPALHSGSVDTPAPHPGPRRPLLLLQPTGGSALGVPGCGTHLSTFHGHRY